MSATAVHPAAQLAPAGTTTTVLWANPRIADDADHDSAATAYSTWCGRTVRAEQVAALDRAAVRYLGQLDGADDPATLVRQLARLGCPRQVAERLVWWQEIGTRILAAAGHEQGS
jgi:hypothetical protein